MFVELPPKFAISEFCADISCEPFNATVELNNQTGGVIAVCTLHAIPVDFPPPPQAPGAWWKPIVLLLLAILMLVSMTRLISNADDITTCGSVDECLHFFSPLREVV